jgi:curved DNA-binding protein CbpA
VLSRLDGPMRLNELIALSGLRELDARRTIYGLALGGFLERQHWPSALQRTEGVASKSVHPTQGGTAKAELVSTPVEIAGQSDAAELDELFAKLDRAESHYEVLNVEATAGAAEIKRSYYALARRYHPDRFHMQAGTELHTRIESAFARIAQAYITLGDAALRSSYDVKLASRERVRQFAQDAPRAHPAGPARTAASENTGGDSSAGGDWERAEDSFQEGFAALQQGQTKLAITNLAAAARIAPQEARFRAYYGRALAAVEDTRRLAEAEMQAAIKLDPENPSYRVMLAELYCDLGFFRRAEGELKRVTSRDPNNPAAHKLMRRLEAARTTT